MYSHNPTGACRRGRFSAQVRIGANTSRVKRTIAFALVARNGTYTSTGRFYFSLAANPHPSPAPPPPTIGPNHYPPGARGYDVSWPQCTTRASTQTKRLPDGPAFAVVGVNNGTISGFNSCFAAEAAWSGNELSVYIILQPAPGGRPVPYEATGPQAYCAATSSECEGYDWGYNYARADLAFVKAQGLGPRSGGWTSRRRRGGPLPSSSSLSTRPSSKVPWPPSKGPATWAASIAPGTSGAR